jgi:predicted O-methyltransferase YrrM
MMRANYAHALAESRGFLCHEDVDLIQEAVRMLPQDRHVLVVDLGAGSGTTALSVFDERSRDIKIFTVDHDPVALASTKECMTNAGYAGNWLSVLSKTADAAGVFQSPDIDLLLIDAGHEYEDVAADLRAWLPLVRPGAPVWLHDTVTGEYPGAIRALDEAIADGRLLVVKSKGWGCLCVKAVGP